MFLNLQFIDLCCINLRLYDLSYVYISTNITIAFTHCKCNAEKESLT